MIKQDVSRSTETIRRLLRQTENTFAKLLFQKLRPVEKLAIKYTALPLAGRSKLQIVQLLDLVIGSMMTTIMLLRRMLMTPEQTVAVHNYVFAMRNSGGDATIAA